MTASLNIALIGCGRIGHLHARNLFDLRQIANVAVVADTRREALDQIEHSFRFSNLTTDVDSIFGDSAIDAVVIASSTSTHAEYITKAAESGKHVFVEKPIALDLETTDLALEVVAKADVQLQIGFQRRFDSGYVAAKKATDEAEIGSVTMIRDAMRDPQPPPADYLPISGGLFRDMSIHNFDCVRWLMGSDPIEIFATGSALVSDDAKAIGDIDTSVVVMRFDSGALATIENSRKSGFGYDVRTEIFGSESAVFVGDSLQTPIRHLNGSGVYQDHQYFFLERFRDAYQTELRSFIENIRSNQPVSPNGDDGRTALALAIAAEESRAAGRPISLEPARSL